MAPLSDITSADGTHKLVWEGFPIFLVGIIDKSDCFLKLFFNIDYKNFILGTYFWFYRETFIKGQILIY